MKIKKIKYAVAAVVMMANVCFDSLFANAWRGGGCFRVSGRERETACSH